MSSAGLWTDEQFNCPVCLDLPTEPVTIPCGHSYCMDCITDHWDTEEQKSTQRTGDSGVLSCPECRQTFQPRPQLCRNTMLAEAVEQLRRGQLSSQVRESIRKSAKLRPARSRKSSGPRVPCERCQEPREALKTCLVCMASFCELHLKPHKTQAKLKSHKLIGPTADLTQKICPEHKYLQEFYCRTCQAYICWLCTSNQHKTHQSVSTQAERNDKQKLLTAVQTENQQKLQDRERELKDMKKLLETLKRSSDSVRSDTEMVLSELQRSVQRLEELVQQVMMSSAEEKITEVQDVVDKLQTETKQLRRKDKELKNLVRCQDNIHFLKKYQCLSAPEVSELGSVTINPEATFDSVRSVILELRERVENICNQDLDKINKTVFNTTTFTVTDRQKGILKLFSGLGGKSTASRSGPPQLPSVSVRGPAPVTRTQDIRTRDEPQVNRGTSSPRPSQRQNREDRDEGDSRSSLTPRERQRREDRQSDRETENTPRSQSRQNTPESPDEQAETWSLRSIRPQARQKREEREPVETSSFHQTPSASIRSRVSLSRQERETVNGDLRSSQRSQQTPTRQQAQRQSDRWSLSSLLPRNRKKKQDSVKEVTPVVQEEAESQSPTANPWGSPTEVNPDLFLDSPTEDLNINPAFPTLREIDLDSIQAPEPRTREEFLQYACELTLDPNTAHRRLTLTEGDTKATLQVSGQLYPDGPERFDGWTQVLCLQPLTSGRCYWEVEWRGRGSSVGVASGSMRRRGGDVGAGLGYNGQSWSLELSDTCCAALHGGQKQEVPVTYCPRVGVYLDQHAGTLSFYSVDEVLVPLHTFHTHSLTHTHTQLYAGFGVGVGLGVGLDFAMGQFSSAPDSIKICPL